MNARRRLRDHLAFLYDNQAQDIMLRLEERLEAFRKAHPDLATRRATPRLSERDSILITYGDMVQAEGEAPLFTLAEFLRNYTSDFISAVHLLPFYPWSSDDGFSVIDYRAVDPALGNWDHVAALGRQFRLMFDAVINHVSAESAWFQAFRRDDERYRDYFTVVPPGTDLSDVFRPRAQPLLTPVTTAAGEKLVWTTFGPDQIDLNYHNHDVLLDIIDVLLFYVARGADLIRLDAIAFMWKELGTDSIHRPQTHAIIQLFRAVLDEVAPHVVLITETNVPHQDNVSYFGDGYNEAQMVYNFSLPPLTLHAFHRESAELLSSWAATLDTPSSQTAFFNFLASHDGVGVTPARGLLSAAAIQAMVERVQALGGYVSYRDNPDGSQSVYELNINFLDALGDPAREEEIALVARRFLASQAIMLALRGVPGVYFHSLFGSRSWHEGVMQTGRNRTINRRKLERAPLARELADPHTLRSLVFTGYRRLLQARRTHAAFHPHGGQEILPWHPAVFTLLRTSPDGKSPVLCLHNVSSQTVEVTGKPPNLRPGAVLQDCLGDLHDTIDAGGRLAFTLEPYAVHWLTPLTTAE